MRDITLKKKISKANAKFRSLVILAIFSVLSSRVWLVAIIVSSAGTEHVCHRRKVFWMVLLVSYYVVFISHFVDKEANPRRSCNQHETAADLEVWPLTPSPLCSQRGRGLLPKHLHPGQF